MSLNQNNVNTLSYLKNNTQILFYNLSTFKKLLKIALLSLSPGITITEQFRENFVSAGTCFRGNWKDMPCSRTTHSNFLIVFYFIENGWLKNYKCVSVFLFQIAALCRSCLYFLLFYLHSRDRCFISHSGFSLSIDPVRSMNGIETKK